MHTPQFRAQAHDRFGFLQIPEAHRAVEAGLTVSAGETSIMLGSFAAGAASTTSSPLGFSGVVRFPLGASCDSIVTPRASIATSPSAASQTGFCWSHGFGVGRGPAFFA